MGRKKGIASILEGRITSVQYEQGPRGLIYDSAIIQVQLGKTRNQDEAEKRIKQLSKQLLKRDVTIQVKKDER